MTSRAISSTPGPINIAPPTGSLLLWVWGAIFLALSIDPLIRLFAGKPVFDASFDSWGGWLVLPLATAALTWAYRRRSLRLDARQLDIASTLYSKSVPLASMRLDRARIVKFEEYPEFRPANKSNGLQFPGFRSGHFRMQDGSKGFCLITDDSRVLVIPLDDGSSVLISPEQPRALLDELKRLAGGSTRA